MGTTQGKSASGQIEWPYRHCDSKDIMVLVCYVILQDSLTKEPSNFVNGCRSRQVSVLPGFVAIGTCDSRDIMVLACHVVSQDHVIK